MQIIYQSNACSDTYFQNLFETSKSKPGQQVQKFHNLLLQGLLQSCNNIKAITARPVTREVTKRIYLSKQTDVSNGIEYCYLPIVNFPLIKHFIIFISSFFMTVGLIRKDNYSIVICDVLNISSTAGALLASIFFNKKSRSLGIVTDLPIDLSQHSYIVKLNDFLISKFDGYVFLTEEMNKKLNKKNKEYLIIEGLVDINMKDICVDVKSKSKKKICLYAGGVYKKYGVEMLVNGFIKANVKDAELHIYGNGDYTEELQRITETYNQIVFLGVVSNSIVVDAELTADLLINPRPTFEEYTKYSFPSKNMEYMVSGTPVLTTKLPGMPEEYLKHVYIIADESIDGVARSIQEVLSKSKEDLYNKGLKAKNFVLNEKNNVIQAQKILNLANRLINRR